MFFEKQEFFAQFTATMLWNEKVLHSGYNLEHIY